MQNILLLFHIMDKTHFMVEVSTTFMMIASSKDTEWFAAMLSYKTLAHSTLNDRHGVYAQISKDERRDRDIRKPAPLSGCSLQQTRKNCPEKGSGKNQTSRYGSMSMLRSVVKRLTPPQSRRTNAHVKKERCNCDNGNCLLLDDGDECVCPCLFLFATLQMISCHRPALDKELYAELYAPEDKRRCEVCNTPFASNSNSVKYCLDCRKRI